MALFGLFRHPKRERAGFALYGHAVAAARAPFFYEALKVPDTLDGRFDLVGVHAFLAIRRLGRSGATAPFAQPVFDAMFSDMDITLREIGVGDMSIGKRVRAMWEAFHGRARSYGLALDAGDGAALTAALSRNVWRAEAADGAGRLARIATAQEAHLAGQDDAALREGRMGFLDPAHIA